MLNVIVAWIASSRDNFFWLMPLASEMNFGEKSRVTAKDFSEQITV